MTADAAPGDETRLVPGADLRLVPAAAAAWAGAGWAVAQGLEVTLAAAGALAVFAVVAIVLARSRACRGRRRVGSWAAGVAMAAACGALAMCSGGAQAEVRRAGLVGDLVADGATVEVAGEVRSAPHAVTPDPARNWEAEPRWTVRLSLDGVSGRGLVGGAATPVLVIGGQEWADVVVGQRVSASGRLQPVEPGDDVTALLLARGAPGVQRGPGPVDAAAAGLRDGLRDASSGLPADARGLLPGLVVGDTSQLPPDLEQAMKDTGLTHLTAVSGSNITIVCGAGLLLAAGCGLPRRARVLAAALVLVAFVVVAGPEPSVLRAGVMGSVGLLGLLGSRRGSGMPALCCAVVVLVTADPWLARAFGFALSVLATSGLLLLARPWAEAMARVVPRWLAFALAVPLAAQAVCGPVTILLTPQVPLTSLPANVLVAPAVAPATVLGVVATVLAPWWSGGAEAVAWLAGWAVRWIALVARTAADVPGGQLAWPEGGTGALLLAAVSAVVLVVVALLAPSLGSVARSRHVLVGSATAAVAVLLIGFTPAGDWLLRPGASWPPDGWRVVACDVGQGDALVVSSGAGRGMVIDVGPDPEHVDGCLDRLGVTRIELLVLTHFHADHVDGLAGALDGRQVDRAVVSPQPDPLDTAERVSRELAAAGVPVEEGRLGQSGRVGDLEYEILWPGRLLGSGGAPAEEGSLANDASVVLSVRTPEMTLLATGDVEPPAQRGLLAELERRPWLGHFDVVKMAHHGSAQQWPPLYEHARPRVALFSAGTDNDYGHPAPDALELAERTGAVVARTDAGGDVAVGVTGQDMWLASRR